MQARALIGQVMKEMKGRGDAAKARELILAKLGASKGLFSTAVGGDSVLPLHPSSKAAHKRL